MISFVGAGPGAPDLMTLRAVDRLRQADVVIAAGSLIPPAILEHCRPDAERYDSKTMTLEEVTAVFEAHPEAAIVRLHSGDPTVYSAIAEQIAWCVAHGRDFEIVPAVGSLSAAAAAAGHELTVPALSQAVVLTRLADRTRASMPPGQSVADLAGHGVTMAVYLSAGRPDALQAALLEGYPPETPALLAYRVSWPDQQLVRTTVGKVAASLRALAATTTVLVLVGPALAEAEPPARSHVYDPGYSHSFRSA